MKKILSLFLILSMLLSTLGGITVFAEGQGELTVTVSDIVDNTVEVKVFITKNPGVAGIDFALDYDKSKVTLVSTSKDNVLFPGAIVGTPNGQVTYVWAQSSNETSVSTASPILVAKFSLNDGFDATTFSINSTSKFVNEAKSYVTFTSNSASVSLPETSDLPVKLTVTAGEVVDNTVEVKVFITQNPGIAGIDLALDYDKSKAALVSTPQDNVLFPGATIGTPDSQVTYVWSQAANVSDVSDTSPILVAKFALNDGFDTTTFSINSASKFANKDKKTVAFTSNSATVVESKTVAVTGVSLNKTSAALEVGETETLIATVLPTTATNQNVSWTSSNPNVASVSNGVVTANAAGTATITVTTADGNKTATCEVTVTEPVVDPDVIYTIGNASGKPGNSVEIPLSVTSRVTVNGLLLDNLDYDKNTLEFVEFAEYGNLITSNVVGASGVDSGKGEISLGYTDAITPNDQICVIKFRIKDTAEDGEYTVSMDGAASAGGQKVPTKVDAGKITVSKWVPGDFDNNEILDMKDVVYFMNWINFSWTGKYPMIYDGNKDFDKDGSIDMKDVVYFMNWVNFSWTGKYNINW